MKRIILLLILSLWCSSAFADWTLPVSASVGSASVSVHLGVQSGATSGYDPGKDTPNKLYEDEVIYASFPHPDWGVAIGGENIYGFLRDIRGSVPQKYILEVVSTQPTVTLSWPSSSLPAKTNFLLRNPATGDLIDMSQISSYVYAPGGMSPVPITIDVSQGDILPPAAPGGVIVEERGNALYVEWDRNAEADLGGYKLHFGTNSGEYSRTINVRNVTNYSLMNLKEDEYYYIALTAYDQNGNESGPSGEVSSSFGVDAEKPLSPVGLAVSSTETAISLRWAANSEADLAGYKVYVGTNYGSYSQSYNIGMTTSFQLSNPRQGQRYYFAVSAYDQSENESSLSSSASGKLKSDSSKVAEPLPPTIPEDDELPTEDEGGGTSPIRVIGSTSVSIEMPGDGDDSTRDSEENKDAEKGSKRKQKEKKEAEQKESFEQVTEDIIEDDPVTRKDDEYRIEFDASQWKLMTIPLSVSFSKPFTEFVARSAEMNRLVGWDSSKQAYLKLKYPRPGAAFWLKAGQGYAKFKGEPYREDNAAFALAKGWNLLGSPYLKNIPVKQVLVKVNDQMLTVAKAIKTGVLSRTIQSYAADEFTYVDLTSAQELEAWRGYWFHAKEPCELVMFAQKIPQAKKSSGKKAK